MFSFFGVDVSKAQHRAWLGTQTTVHCRKFEFTHTREGCGRLAQTRKAHLVNNGRQPIRIAMAPSGLS